MLLWSGRNILYTTSAYPANAFLYLILVWLTWYGNPCFVIAKFIYQALKRLLELKIPDFCLEWSYDQAKTKNY